MDNLFVVIIITVLIVWFVYARFARLKPLRELDADDFKQALLNTNGHMLIDVREPAEVSQGKIAGAINIPLSQLHNRLAEVPRDRVIFLYCRSGFRSRQAAKWLLADGVSMITHLKGGIIAWKGELIK